MQPWIATLIGAGISLAGFIGTIVVQSRAAARIEGALGADVKGLQRDVRKLEAEQDQQWSKINAHGESIAALESQVKQR